LTTTIIAASDLHINSTVALCKPLVQLDDGGSFHPSRAQRWLWGGWLEFCQHSASQPGRRIAVLNGDIGELDTQRRSLQLISTNKDTIIRLVIDTLEPLLSVVDAVYVVRGTAAHSGKSAWLEEHIANDLDHAVKAAPAKTEPPFSHWHIRATCDGVRLDIAHHAHMGGAPWTRLNGAQNLASKMIFQYARMGQPAPHVAIRSHMHQWADSYDAQATRVIMLPAWSLKTEYIYRIGEENTVSDIGGLFAVCEDGHYKIEKFRHEAPRRNVWATKM
jgi:hypothetical protein